MKKLSLLFVLFSLVFVACEEDNEITATLVRTGDFKVTVATPTESGEVTFFESTDDYEYLTWAEETIGDNGVCTIKDVLQGDYDVNISQEKDGQVYGENVMIQIIAGETTETEVDPLSNAGDITFTLLDTDGNPQTGIHAVIVPIYNYYLNDYTHDQILDVATQQGVTNAAGVVTFTDLPVQHIYTYYYSLYLYVDEESNFLSNNNYYAFKDTEKTYTIYHNF